MFKVKNVTSRRGYEYSHLFRQHYEITLLWIIWASYTRGRIVIRAGKNLAIQIKDTKQHSLCFSERMNIKCFKIGKYIIRNLNT